MKTRTPVEPECGEWLAARSTCGADQQLSGTFGGPIRRDRIHFFANYEFEREPRTVTFNSPYPSFNVDLPGTRKQHTAGLRLAMSLDPHPAKKGGRMVRDVDIVNVIAVLRGKTQPDVRVMVGGHYDTMTMKFKPGTPPVYDAEATAASSGTPLPPPGSVDRMARSWYSRLRWGAST
jgi:hypothetical protein